MDYRPPKWMSDQDIYTQLYNTALHAIYEIMQTKQLKEHEKREALETLRYEISFELDKTEKGIQNGHQ